MKEGGIFTILDNCLQKLDIYNSNSKFKYKHYVHCLNINFR